MQHDVCQPTKVLTLSFWKYCDFIRVVWLRVDFVISSPCRVVDFKVKSAKRSENNKKRFCTHTREEILKTSPSSPSKILRISFRAFCDCEKMFLRPKMLCNDIWRINKPKEKMRIHCQNAKINSELHVNRAGYSRFFSMFKWTSEILRKNAKQSSEDSLMSANLVINLKMSFRSQPKRSTSPRSIKRL